MNFFVPLAPFGFLFVPKTLAVPISIVCYEIYIYVPINNKYRSRRSRYYSHVIFHGTMRNHNTGNVLNLSVRIMSCQL